MRPADPVSTAAIIYAEDLASVAAFYEQTLQLERIEAEPTHVLLRRSSVEVVVVQSPEDRRATGSASDPPALRTGTPLKVSFLVNDLEQVRRAALATGGGLKAQSSMWIWRDHQYLDGNDPEGNVVQFRVAQH